MTDRQDNDTQRQHDLSQQRGYGESTDRDKAASLPGVKSTHEGQTEGADHGFLRDDGQARPEGTGTEQLDAGNNPVLSPRDERHPNAPATLNSDKGAARSKAEPQTKTPDDELLKNAYSVNRDGVETKS